VKLSPNFTLEEFTTSQVATRLGIDNTPPPVVVDNLQRLCVDVLEPLRRAINAPIIISSGYRCPELNRAVHGSAGSGHMYGTAADLIVPTVPVRKVCQHVLLLRLRFDQLIDEFGRWTHVSIAAKDAKPRGHQLEARLAKPRGVTYTPVSFIAG